MKRKVFVGDKHIATINTKSFESAIRPFDVGSDDPGGWKPLRSDPVEMIIIADSHEYTAYISREDYWRMIDDGLVE